MTSRLGRDPRLHFQGGSTVAAYPAEEMKEAMVTATPCWWPLG